MTGLYGRIYLKDLTTRVSGWEPPLNSGWRLRSALLNQSVQMGRLIDERKADMTTSMGRKKLQTHEIQVGSWELF